MCVPIDSQSIADKYRKSSPSEWFNSEKWKRRRKKNTNQIDEEKLVWKSEFNRTLRNKTTKKIEKKNERTDDEQIKSVE